MLQMTKQLKLWLPILCLSVIIFTSACQGGEDILNPPTADELLSDDPWLYTAHTIEPGMLQGTFVITDLYAQLDSCDQDNIYSFTSTGVFNLEQGDIRCTPNSDQIIDNGTWTVNDDETVLSLDFSTLDDITYEISELDRKELVLIKKYTDNGINFTETLTFDTVE